MKKNILLTLVLFSITTGYSQHKSKVSTFYNKEIYIFAEPLREYEILKGTNSSTQWTSGLTRGLVNPSIKDRVVGFIQKLTTEYAKKGETFDAVLYTGGKEIKAIRFTGPPTQENFRTAFVREVNNIPFFVLSKPVGDYQVVSKVSNGLKLKSFATLGFVNNSIEQDLKSFTNKVKRKFKKGKIEALIYIDKKKAHSIKFKH